MMAAVTRLITSILMFASTAAYSAPPIDLLTMSLEDLLNVQVVTVSKRNERLVEAPSVVTVITAKDIQAFGARNVKDILLRTTNFYMFDSATFNATGSTLRAGATQHINNHILYLVNGRPLRESQNGGRHTDINLMFPVTAIERIEIIRGPGSVLYGSNAYSGTINIITKPSTEQPSLLLQATGGQDNYTKGTLSASSQFAKGEGHIEAHVNHLSEDGATITAIDDQNQVGSNQLSRDGYFANVNAGYKGFNLQALASNVTLPTVSGAYRWSGLSDFKLTRKFIDLGYNHDFNQDWSSSLHYTLNKSGLSVDGPRNSEYSSDGYLYEFTVNGRISDRAQLLFGIVSDKVKGDLGESRGGAYQSTRNSLYAQVDYQLYERTKLTAGLQQNQADQQNADTSPRLALIHNFNNEWSSKIMYAEAYRSAYGAEIGFESAFLQGDPSLKPERISTSETQLLFANQSLFFSGTLYHSTSSDSIGRNRVGGTTFFVNSDTQITYYGIELESRWSINSHWQLVGNASYQTNKDADNNRDVMIAANEMLKVGLSYTSKRGYTASLWNSYFGAPSKLEDQPAAEVLVVNPNASSFNLLSFNLNANLGDLLDNPSWAKASISLYADNLLDEDVWYPELGQKSVNTFPQSHARGIYGTLTFQL